MIFNPVLGGGGGGAVLGTKTITANGTYNASSDNLDGYSQVVANVPNTYAAGDEGKVVSNGALVAQSSENITQNGTYDTTLKNQVVVNVSGGGTGAMVTPAFYGLSYGYIAINGWFYSYTGQNTCLNIFNVVAGHNYEIYIGETYGTRFRVHYYANKTLSDFSPYISAASSNTAIYECTANISGTSEITDMTKRFLYSPSANGVVIIATDNTAQMARAYCVDVDYVGNVTSLIPKIIEANGTYDASADGADGYSQVTANVSPLPLLPSEYQRVKYLQATGNQYAEVAGISIPTNSALRIIFQSASTAEITIMGYADSPTFDCYTSGNDCPALGWGGSSIQRFTNGNLYDVQQFAIWKASAALTKAYLCCYRTSGNMYRYVGKVYRITISNSFALDWNEIGTALYDFIPCYRKLDGVAGFYETVTGTFYSSATGTAFIAGPSA